MKHIVATRFLFKEDNYELMEWYIEVCKNTLIPSLQGQICHDFVWGIIVSSRHEEWLKSHLKGTYDFITFNDYEEFKDAGYNTQTRHDIDDIMESKYIAYIQDMIKIYQPEKAILYCNLTLHDYFTKKDAPYPVFSADKTSQFVTLYQKDILKGFHVYMDEHTKLPRYIQPVIELPFGLCKQVKHGKNISK